MQVTYRQIYNWLQNSLPDDYLDTEALFYEPYTDTYNYIDELTIEPYPLEHDNNIPVHLQPVMKGKEW